MWSSSGTFLKYIEYNADGSSATDWFSAGRFVSSSWSDLHSGVTHNYWAMGWVVGALKACVTVNMACSLWIYLLFYWQFQTMLKGKATFEAHFHVLPKASYSWLWRQDKLFWKLPPPLISDLISNMLHSQVLIDWMLICQVDCQLVWWYRKLWEGNFTV